MQLHICAEHVPVHPVFPVVPVVPVQPVVPVHEVGPVHKKLGQIGHERMLIGPKCGQIVFLAYPVVTMVPPKKSSALMI
jgi:hypothetical protein